MGYQFEQDPSKISVPLGSPDTNALGQTKVWDGTQAYIQQPDGTRTVIEAPGSAVVQLLGLSFPGAPPPGRGNSTSIQALNDRGVAVGFYTDADGKVHGFIYDGQGNYTTIDVPNASATWVQGVGYDGEIRGVYIGADGMQHNFVGIPQGFKVSDQTSGTSWSDIGVPYTGPVNGLTTQELLNGLHNYNVTAELPNVFIHTGAGDDSLVATAGNNVLDGGTGSNFLVGGPANDQFFVDDRSPSADIWSTITNFKAGDVVVIWGVTKQDMITWQNNQGAAGYTGLTFHTGNEPTAASMTLPRYDMQDLGNRLAVSYGHTDDQPNLPGSDYMMIRGV